MPVGVAGIPTGPAGPHGPPPVGPPGPHGHPHPGSVAAAQLEAAERLALSTDPMVRLQMAGISPEYHAHTHAHTHAHSHTHLHLHPSQQAQQAQAQEAAAAAAGTAGFPLPGEWHYADPDKLGKNCFQGITILCQALGLKSLPSSASACMLLEGLQFVYCKEWQQIIGQFGGLVIFYENVWRSFTAQNSHQYSNFFPHVCKFIIFPLME